MATTVTHEQQHPARSLSRHTVVSVIVPCYNEAPVLNGLRERLQAAMNAWGTDFEVILVDDGSQDATWDMIRQFHRQDPRWHGIRLSRNYGHQTALWAGLEAARGDVVAVLDADLQDPPEALGDFLWRWQQGYDVVYAIRHNRKENPLLRAAYHIFYRVLAFLAEIDIPLDAGDFCVMDRRVVEAMRLTREQEPFIRGLRAWVGFRQVGCPYVRAARVAGASKYTLRKLVRLATSGVFSFSVRPLRLAVWLGFAVSLLSAVGVIFYFVQRLFPEAFARAGFPLVPGFATIIIALLFLGGTQLICLGILGEYVGRIFENVKGRPRFIASETTDAEASP